MTEPAVLYDVADHVATITLNRPENRNSMTPDVLDALADSLAKANADSGVRCLIITGNGKSFCAGADFKTGAQAESRGNAVMSNERSFAIYQSFLAVLDIEVPVIGALNGHAIGGGLGLAMVCDMRVANRDAKYGANFTKLGLHPGMSTTYLLPRLVGIPRAAELLLTGRIITGAEAARELAAEVASCAPIATRWTKRSLYEHVYWDPVRAGRHEAELQSRTIETEDFKEGVDALLNKRAPNFIGR